jgi:integrase
MDRWAWEQLDPWLTHRATLPVGALFCILRGPTRGRRCAPAGLQAQLRSRAEAAGVRRRFAPHQLRHAHAVEMSGAGVPLLVIQRQLGHADVGITSAYLRGIDNAETIEWREQRRGRIYPLVRPSYPPSCLGGERQSGGECPNGDKAAVSGLALAEIVPPVAFARDGAHA